MPNVDCVVHLFRFSAARSKRELLDPFPAFSADRDNALQTQQFSGRSPAAGERLRWSAARLRSMTTSTSEKLDKSRLVGDSKPRRKRGRQNRAEYEAAKSESGDEKRGAAARRGPVAAE